MLVTSCGLCCIMFNATFNNTSCEFEPRSWWDVHDTTLCDKICRRLATDRWFSPGIPASSTNKTVYYDVIEVLLKVALNIMKHKPQDVTNMIFIHVFFIIYN
jgi:hypothetical protein